MFDLVYTDRDHVDQGVILAYRLDAAWGADENNFEIVLPSDSHIDFGALVYVDGTQLGGVIDAKSPDGTGEVSTVTYTGRTWHGILAGSVISPDEGEDYYTYDGDANDVIRAIIARQGLGDVFACEGSSGIAVKGRFDRFANAYAGLSKMLTRDAAARGKLSFEKAPGGKCMLQAVQAAEYTDEVDSDRYGFKSVIDSRPVNHLVCLGEGDLKDRDVVHLYADADGNVSTTQTFFGIDERAETYEYNNVEHDELVEAGIEKLEELQMTSGVEMTVVSDLGVFDVGDVVGAFDNLTGLYAESVVTKVVANVDENGIATYSYDVGDLSTMSSSSSSGGGVSMATLQAKIDGIGDGYVKSTGDTITGAIARDAGGSWISARDNVAVAGLKHGQPAGNSYNPVISQKTTSGEWSIGNLSGNEGLYFSYTTDDDYSSGTNAGKQYTIGTDGTFSGYCNKAHNKLTIIPDNTYATNTFADSNPKIVFQNSNASQNLSLTYSDYDSAVAPSSLTLNGNQGDEVFIAPKIRITSTADVGGTTASVAPLSIGSPTGAHLEFDGNEIMAKATDKTVADLYINNDGGAVYLQGYRAINAKNANSYWGMTEPGGGDSNWIRTTTSGIIPVKSGGASALGTSSWPFTNIYGNNIYGLGGNRTYGMKQLYANTTGTNGTVSLNESAANFTYMTIVYKSNDGFYSGITIAGPNGKSVLLVSGWAGGSGGGNTKLASKAISGTSITTNSYSLFDYNGFSASNQVYITFVIGYK